MKHERKWRKFNLYVKQLYVSNATPKHLCSRRRYEKKRFTIKEILKQTTHSTEKNLNTEKERKIVNARNTVESESEVICV